MEGTNCMGDRLMVGWFTNLMDTHENGQMGDEMGR